MCAIYSQYTVLQIEACFIPWLYTGI
jgi:hypothetical protein